jgi:oligosaccharide repeat unit polymerase
MNPIKIALLVWLIVILLLVSGIVGYTVSIKLHTWTLIISVSGVFLLGWKSLSTKQIISVNLSSCFLSRKLFIYAILFSYLGAILTCYDYIYVRNIPITFNTNEMRTFNYEFIATGSSGGFNIIRMIGRIGVAIGIISMAIFFYNKKYQTDKILYSLMILLILVLFSQFITGTRNASAMILVYIGLSYYSNRKYLKKKYNTKIKYLSYVVLLVSFFLMSKVFLDRSDQYNTLANKLFILNKTHLGSNVYYFQSETLNNIEYLLYYWLTYITHSFVELDIIIDNKIYALFNGSYNFIYITEFIKRLGIAEIGINETKMYHYRGGRYYTLMGDLLVDFGIIGTFFTIYIIGFLSKYSYRNRFKTPFQYALNNYFCLLLVFSPFYSIFPNGNSVGFLIGLILYILIALNRINILNKT